MIRRLLYVLALIPAFSFADVEYINSEKAAAQNLPFSQAVRVNDLIFLSGQLGTDENFNLVEGGIVPQAHQIFANMKAILDANNSSLANIVKCTVMLEDIGEWPRFNEVYVTYFPGNKPSRSAFGADGLALGGAVEMECWAVTSSDD